MIPSRLNEITARQIEKNAPDNIAVGTVTSVVGTRRYTVSMEGRWRGIVRASADTNFSDGDRVNLILPGGDLNNAQILGLSSKTNPVIVTITYGEGDCEKSGIEDPLITMEDEAYLRAREVLQGGKVGRRYTVPFLCRSGVENIRPGAVIRVTAPEAGLIGAHLCIESVSESYSNEWGQVLKATGVLWKEWKDVAEEDRVYYFVNMEGDYILPSDGDRIIIKM